MGIDFKVDRAPAVDEDHARPQDPGSGCKAGPVGPRILHPLRLSEGSTGDAAERGPYVGVALDVETTGLDPEKGRIVELALRRFRYDRDGVITDIDAPCEWREDPGEPLTAEITALTGLTDADVAGREIDEGAATRMLRSASFVVAHNAAFDRRWVEKRLPGARKLAWCCSMAQVDWRARGFDGRVLGYLLTQAGFYHCGHRASADVDALIQLLRDRGPSDRTALAEMVERGSRPTWLIRARGADFSVKDDLKARGYRWDGERRVWWTEVADAALVPEQFWLAANVYTVTANPKKICPEIVRVTARSRFL